MTIEQKRKIEIEIAGLTMRMQELSKDRFLLSKKRSDLRHKLLLAKRERKPLTHVQRRNMWMIEERHEHGTSFTELGKRFGISKGYAHTVYKAHLRRTVDRENYLKNRTSEEAEWDSLGLSARVYNSLYMSGVKTLDKLCSLSERELRRLRVIGPLAVYEIKTALARKGRELANS